MEDSVRQGDQSRRQIQTAISYVVLHIYRVLLTDNGAFSVEGDGPLRRSSRARPAGRPTRFSCFISFAQMFMYTLKNNHNWFPHPHLSNASNKITHNLLSTVSFPITKKRRPYCKTYIVLAGSFTYTRNLRNNYL